MTGTCPGPRCAVPCAAGQACPEHADTWKIITDDRARLKAIDIADIANRYATAGVRQQSAKRRAIDDPGLAARKAWAAERRFALDFHRCGPPFRGGRWTPRPDQIRSDDGIDFCTELGNVDVKGTGRGGALYYFTEDRRKLRGLDFLILACYDGIDDAELVGWATPGQVRAAPVVPSKYQQRPCWKLPQKELQPIASFARLLHDAGVLWMPGRLVPASTFFGKEPPKHGHTKTRPRPVEAQHQLPAHADRD